MSPRGIRGTLSSQLRLWLRWSWPEPGAAPETGRYRSSCGGCFWFYEAELCGNHSVSVKRRSKDAHAKRQRRPLPGTDCYCLFAYTLLTITANKQLKFIHWCLRGMRSIQPPFTLSPWNWSLLQRSARLFWLYGNLFETAECCWTCASVLITSNNHPTSNENLWNAAKTFSEIILWRFVCKLDPSANMKDYILFWSDWGPSILSKTRLLIETKVKHISLNHAHALINLVYAFQVRAWLP